MANTFNQFTGTGSQTDYVITFPYLLSTHVKVYEDGVENTAFSFITTSTIQMDSAPGSGVSVKVVRETEQDTVLTDFEDGANLVENDLDTATLQNFYLMQEALDSIGLFGVQNLATSAHILIGDGTDFVNKAVTGDVTLSAAGVTAITALAATKIADGSVSDAEFQYLNGVTSAIQTQIDGINAGTISTLDDDNFTLQDNGDSTKKAQFQCSGITTGNTRTYTLPDLSTTLGNLLSTNNLSELSSASTARTNLGVAIGSDVQAYDADTLKADTADVLTAGFASDVHDAGTKSSGTFTPDEATLNFKEFVNGGAFTLAPPTNNCTMILKMTNNGSAGVITTSGFTVVDGDTLTTTNTEIFLLYITKIDGTSLLTVKAMQ